MIAWLGLECLSQVASAYLSAAIASNFLSMLPPGVSSLAIKISRIFFRLYDVPQLQSNHVVIDDVNQGVVISILMKEPVGWTWQVFSY
jgi:hypothetical protein